MCSRPFCNNLHIRLCLLAILFIAIFRVLWRHSSPATNTLIPGISSIRPLSPSYISENSHDWPKTIWQTSKAPVLDLSPEERERYETWQRLNPDYRHEIMTDEKMAQYVRERFGGTETEETYFEIRDYILLSDLFRYLVLLQDGGAYNDLDVACEKPIDTWVPQEFRESAGVLLGVEVDNKFGPDGRTYEGGTDLFELVNWTMMAKPHQPFIQLLVQRVLENVRDMAERQKTSIRHMEVDTIQEVLQSTGPAAVTNALFDYATNITQSTVTYKNFTKMPEPKLIGEVVILPIHAFGARHQVEWAGFKEDRNQVLVHHYFSGSWYSDHIWAPSTEAP